MCRFYEVCSCADGLWMSIPTWATARTGNAANRDTKGLLLVKSGRARAATVSATIGTVTNATDGDATSRSTIHGTTVLQARPIHTPAIKKAPNGVKDITNIGVSNPMIRNHQVSGRGAASKPSVGMN